MVENIDVKEQEQKDAIDQKIEGWEDPGQKEGLKKKDPVQAQDGITEDHPRFKQVYGKMKHLERELEMLKKGYKDDPMFKQIVAHNQKLQLAIEKMSENPARVEIVDKRQGDEITTLESQLKEKKEARREALSSLKHDESEKLDDEIYDLRKKIDGARDKAKADEDAKAKADADAKAKADAKAGELAPEVQQVYDEWMDTIPWIANANHKGLDKETKSLFSKMKKAAMNVDEMLEKDPEWKDSPLEERLEEVKRIVEARFNYQGDNDNFRDAQFVDSGKGSHKGSPTHRRQSSHALSSEEAKMCTEMGLDPKQYLAQRNFIERGA